MPPDVSVYCLFVWLGLLCDMSALFLTFIDNLTYLVKFVFLPEMRFSAFLVLVYLFLVSISAFPTPNATGIEIGRYSEDDDGAVQQNNAHNKVNKKHKKHRRFHYYYSHHSIPESLIMPGRYRSVAEGSEDTGPGDGGAGEDDELNDGDPDERRRQEETWSFYSHIAMIIALLLIAAIVSGLTIGYMSLDMNTLKILIASGTEKQRKYAAQVEPIRKKGHLLLCTLLICNMLANETVPILLDDLLLGYGGGEGEEGEGSKNSVLAVILSTILIVLFAEIIPQAVCSRYALALGAKCAFLVRILMIIVWPVAFPISWLLTKILGKHEGTIYRRNELKQLVSLHGPAEFGELSMDEVRMISSILDLKNISIGKISTPLRNAFMLDVNTTLSTESFKVINATGYSRIPIYKNSRDNIVGMVLVKRLLHLRPNSKLRIRDVKHFAVIPMVQLHESMEVFDALRVMIEKRSHLACVMRNPFVDNHMSKMSPSSSFDGMDVRRNSDTDAQTKQSVSSSSSVDVMGIVSMEDILEVLIGCDIVDETDLFVKRPRTAQHLINSREMSDNEGTGLDEKAPLLKPNMPQLHQYATFGSLPNYPTSLIPSTGYSRRSILKKRARRAGSHRGFRVSFSPTRKEMEDRVTLPLPPKFANRQNAVSSDSSDDDSWSSEED